VAHDPAAGRAGGDPQLEAAPAGFSPPLDDPGQDRQGVGQLPFPRQPANLDRVPVQRPGQAALQLGQAVEVRDRANDPRPLSRVEPMAVLGVDLLPGLEDGALGVEDQAVEVEDQRANSPGYVLSSSRAITKRWISFVPS
jgi:hypothetical protein